MSTLHKVKAYFGMAPMEDYDDEYYDDEEEDRVPPRTYQHSGERFAGDGFSRYAGRDYGDMPGSYRGGYDDEPRFRPREFDRSTEFDRPRDFDRPREFDRPRYASMRGSTRGSLAMDPRRMAMMFDEGSTMSKITTLRPKDYSEARTIGERFRDGNPVIMDLVSMDNADAKRLVDFAAGLAFALRGSFDKVATKVFLLSPADVDVSPEERRRIAESGFYAHQ